MKSYHLTQEQAVIVVKDCDHSSIVTGNGNLYQFTECQLKAYANAVLDKVLGEPIAKVNNEGFIVELDELQIVEGTKLYAPKEQS